MPKKKCRACHEWIHSDDVYVAALEHWIDRHPRDDRLFDVLTDQWVEVDCQDCGQPFFSPVSYGRGRIGAEAYCPDCDDVGFRRVMAQTLTAAELVECEADPAEDTLGDGGGACA